MKPTAPPRTDAISSRRVRDPYADLLRDTRGLRRDQAAARDAWFAGLAVDRKEEILFELEMLLKGLVAWGNPRNHPSNAPREPLRERNFRPHLAVVRAVVRSCLALSGQLLGSSRRGSGLTRQLPMGFSEEPRGEREAIAETPDGALFSLRQSLTVSAELIESLLCIERIPYRLFYATVLGVQREVARNPFFNPLFALEFRPEFDRVRVPDVLDAILSVDGETAHRLVALTYLGVFRLLRMTTLLQTVAHDPDGVARSWALLAALRADARVLAHILRHRASSMLADSLERDLMRVPATEVRGRYDAVVRDCERLRRLRAVLLAAGAALRAETRRIMEVRVPGCDAMAPPQEVVDALNAACARLRDSLQGVVVQVTWALRGGADAERLFGDRNAKRSAGERLRQGAWMFTVVTRAFMMRARGVNADDVWSVEPGLGFVHEYLGYYRAIGLSLAQETDYGRGEALAQALAALRDADWIDASRLHTAVTECDDFNAHLAEVIKHIGQREELRATPFDKAAAGETLRMYLGA